MSSYLEKYGCEKCPVKQYCGTMIQSTKLCKSFDYNDKYQKQGIVLIPENSLITKKQ